MKQIQTSLVKVLSLRQAGRALLPLAALLLLAASVAAVYSQTGNGYDLSWRTVGGGGYTFSESGDYSLGGTIGQADAGVLTSGDYTLVGGFWSSAGVSTGPETRPVYLPVVLKNYP